MWLKPQLHLIFLNRITYNKSAELRARVDGKNFPQWRALVWECAGENFSFTEAQESSNVAVAYLGSFALIIGYFIISLKFLRPLVMRLLPKPGEGPSKKQQVEGFWCAPYFNCILFGFI